MILTELIRGFYPYPRPNNFIEMVENLQNLPPPQLPGGIYSAELVDFIGGCMRTEPERRASVQQLLAHPWMTSHANTKVDLLNWYRQILK